MKLGIIGASDWVKRMYEACGQYQWAREFLQNSIEAGATRVEFGVEWKAVEKLGVYRRYIADNGWAMDEQELLNYFSTLGAGNKKIGGVHDNFGIGSKVSSLPWNPNGVVVISRKNQKHSMIMICLDEDNDYELVDFETDEEKTCVIDPTKVDWPDADVNWAQVMPDWIGDHGTMIILLGSDDNPDTVRGNVGAGEDIPFALSKYLNTRFWDLSGLVVQAIEFDHKQKADWPMASNWTPDRRPHPRNITGAKYFLDGIQGKNGKLAHSEPIRLQNGRLLGQYYLWEGDRPQISHYAQEGGYIAVKYKNELFEASNKKVLFRSFGIVDSQVQRQFTLILEPAMYYPGESDWGIHPDQSRNRLNFTCDGLKGAGLPLVEWGQEFASNLPEPVLVAIRKARAEVGSSNVDEEYRKRLQDKFGNRWKMPIPFQSANKEIPDSASLLDESTKVHISNKRLGLGAGSKARPKLALRNEAKFDPAGTSKAEQQEVPADFPRYEFAPKEDFEKPWHIAMWVSNHPKGPTVILNQEAETLEESIRYHQQQYAPVFAEEVQRVVLQVYGEVAVCKLAHSQKLRRRVSKEELDRDYRSEPALTTALLGLMAEESVISKRLLGLGKRSDMNAKSS